MSEGAEGVGSVGGSVDGEVAWCFLHLVEVVLAHLLDVLADGAVGHLCADVEVAAVAVVGPDLDLSLQTALVGVELVAVEVLHAAVEHLLHLVVGGGQFGEVFAHSHRGVEAATHAFEPAPAAVAVLEVGELGLCQCCALLQLVAVLVLLHDGEGLEKFDETGVGIEGCGEVDGVILLWILDAAQGFDAHPCGVVGVFDLEHAVGGGGGVLVVEFRQIHRLRHLGALSIADDVVRYGLNHHLLGGEDGQVVLLAIADVA